MRTCQCFALHGRQKVHIYTLSERPNKNVFANFSGWIRNQPLPLRTPSKFCLKKFLACGKICEPSNELWSEYRKRPPSWSRAEIAAND
jgi:hypothetical protein